MTTAITPASTTPTLALPDLADRINRAHNLCAASARTTLEHAREAGDALAMAKSQIPHGGWLTWQKANCPGLSYRTAARYMQVAANWPAIQGKSATVAHLTVTGAIEALSAEPVREPRSGRSGPTPRPFDELPFESRESTCRLWWDQCASNTVRLSAEGWSVDDIAEHTGRPVDEIERILDPKPPVRFLTKLDGSEFVPEVQERYQTQVDAQIAFSIHMAYHTAVRSSSRERCSPAALAELTALERVWKRRHAHLSAKPSWFGDVLGDGNLRVRLWCCAVADFRAAVGIAPPEFVGHLVFHLAEWGQRANAGEYVPRVGAILDGRECLQT